MLPPPLPTLKWGLGRGGSWLHPSQSFGCTAYSWALLGWPCLLTRCSITASSCDLAFLLHHSGAQLNPTKMATSTQHEWQLNSTQAKSCNQIQPNQIYLSDATQTSLSDAAQPSSTQLNKTKSCTAQHDPGGPFREVQGRRVHDCSSPCCKAVATKQQ